MTKRSSCSGKNILPLFLFLVSSFLTDSSFSSDLYGSESLGFFRVVEDKAVYDQHPQKFKVLVFKSSAGSYEIYVEQVPSLQISGAEVKSVTLEKVKMHSGDKGIEEIAREALGTKSEKNKDEFPVGYVYKARFSLTEKAGKIFNEFARKHDQVSFDFRLGEVRLAIVQFIGPFEAGPDKNYEFTAFLEEKNPDRLKEIFGPINKNRVIWK
jgi:hypothetical protein